MPNRYSPIYLWEWVPSFQNISQNLTAIPATLGNCPEAGAGPKKTLTCTRTQPSSWFRHLWNYPILGIWKKAIHTCYSLVTPSSFTDSHQGHIENDFNKATQAEDANLKSSYGHYSEKNLRPTQIWSHQCNSSEFCLQQCFYWSIGRYKVRNKDFHKYFQCKEPSFKLNFLPIFSVLKHPFFWWKDEDGIW